MAKKGWLIRKARGYVARVRGSGTSAPSPETPPEVGRFDFGSFRRLDPISESWGYDRGSPVDRYYIEQFLDRHREDIQGRVVEVADNVYTRRFGDSRVERSDVLDLRSDNRRATIVADLEHASAVASATFDCAVVTQTLHLVYDVRSAVSTLHRVVRPGGVVLATFPGITPIHPRDTWYWALMPAAAERVFGGVFGRERVEVEARGNALAAAAFLYGLGEGELRRDELEYRDPRYPVVVCVRAVRSDG